MAIAAIAAALLYLPASSAWMREKLGFVAFAAFYLASPIVLPQPWPYFLDETTNVYALAGLIALVGVTAVGLRVTQWITRDMRVVFLLVFVAAALVPVSSMTGGGRYLYLASVERLAARRRREPGARQISRGFRRRRSGLRALGPPARLRRPRVGLGLDDDDERPDADDVRPLRPAAPET